MTDPTYGVLRAAVSAAVMAPSSHNTQPWRFEIFGNALHIRADHQRHLKVIDRDGRQLMMSCGCALLNARATVRAMGFDDIVTLLPEDDVIAKLELGDRIVSTEGELALMRAIPERHTNRHGFLKTPVSAAQFELLEETAALNGAWMVRLYPEQKQTLAQLIDDADRLQYGDPEFRHELGRWLTSVISRRRDGIPFSEKEYGSSIPFGLMRALRSPGLGEQFGALEEELVRGAPVVAVLGTRGDEPRDWLACGEALQAVLLHATHLGLAASFLNQVLELPASRTQVAALVDRQFPQMVIRIGHPAEQVRQPAPRRPIDDVLI